MKKLQKNPWFAFLSATTVTPTAEPNTYRLYITNWINTSLRVV